MNPVQRSMTTAFRKSANVQASDFYQSAGDQAFASAIQGVGQLANKLKVQKQQAEYEQISQQRSMEFSVFRREMDENPSINSELEAANFADKNRNKYTKSKNKWVSDKLKKDYKLEELELTSRGIITAKNESRRVVINSLKTQEDSVSDSIESGAKTSDLKNKYTETVMTAVSLGNISKEAAQFRMRQFNQKVSVEDVNIKMNESDTINELNELKTFNKTLLDNKDISTDQFTAIENKIKNKKNKIQEINKIRLKDQFNEINKSALQGENLSEEDLQIFGQIFGHKELLKLEDSIEETTVKYLAYDKIKAPLFISDEQIDSYRAEIVFSLKKEYPEYSSQIPGWVDDALNVRKSARNEAIKNEDNSVIYEGMGKILEGDLYPEDLEKFAFDKTGRESTSAIKRIQQELNKDAPGTLQVYMSKSMGIDYFDLNSNASKLFNPNVSLEDKGDILKNIANDYKTLINKYKSSLPHTESFLPNNIVTSVSNTFLDDMPDSAVRRKETVGFLQTLVGKENLYAASKQISKNFGKDKSVAAEMLAISDGFLNGKEDVADFINNANNKWNALNKKEQNLIEVDFIKDFADEGGNAYDPVLFEERKRLALKLYSQSKDIKSALSMSFDQSTIQVQGYSSSFISIPNSYYSNLNSQTVKLTDNDKTKISETLDTVSELLSYNIQEVISWDEIDKFSSRQDGKYTDVNSSNPFKREKAKKDISDMVDDKSFYYRFNPNGNAISLYFKDKENGYGELVMNMPLDNILEVKTLEVEDFTDVYGVIGNRETHLESKKNRLNFMKDLAK